MLNLYPSIKVIGEEGASDLNVPKDWLVSESCATFLTQSCPESLKNVSDEDIVVWVDPLDGTNEYTQGFLEHVTVLIGIAIKDKAIGGVIHQPYFKTNNGDIGRTIWGVKGIGIGGFEPKCLPSDQLVVTTTRTHSNALVDSTLNAIQPSKIIRVGGAGYKVLQLLEGMANVYVFASAGCKKWDTCAPEAILEAANGVLTDISGVHYSYNADVEHMNKFGVLATCSNELHQKIISQIPDSVKIELNKVKSSQL